MRDYLLLNVDDINSKATHKITVEQSNNGSSIGYSNGGWVPASGYGSLEPPTIFNYTCNNIMVYQNESNISLQGKPSSQIHIKRLDTNKTYVFSYSSSSMFANFYTCSELIFSSSDIGNTINLIIESS